MNNLVGKCSQVKPSDAGLKHSYLKQNLQPPRSGIISSSDVDIESLQREEAHLTRNRYKNRIKPKNTINKTALDLNAFSFYPFWRDPRNLIITNLVRASTSNIKDSNPLFANWLMFGLIYFVLYGKGYGEFFLQFQSIMSFIDVICSSGIGGKKVNFLIGHDMKDYLNKSII